MIYIDPPYNTTNDFIYQDDYSDNLNNYKRLTGQVDSEGNKLSTSIDSSGRYHSKWLSMIYPRLRLSRNLLSDNGVVFISIDDHEVYNLYKICEEIFGSDNIEILVWQKSGLGRYGKMKNTTTFRNDHEYIIVCYKKHKELNKSFEKPNFQNKYPNPDNDYRGPYKAGAISKREDASNPNHKNFYTVKSPSGKSFTRQFDISEEDFIELNSDNRIYWGKNGDSVPSLKIFINEKRIVTTSSVINNCSTNEGTEELSVYFDKDLGQAFRPKPIKLLLKLLQIGSDENDIILDFFSGSGTTGESVIRFNSEMNSNRKFILVQLDERTDEKFLSKYGIKKISEIGKIRLKEFSKTITSKIDKGFKVFNLDSSNIKSWDGSPENLKSSLFDSVSNIKSDRSEEDVLYEILLKYGLDLTLPIQERDINGRKVFNVGLGSLFICLGDDITSKVAEGIGKWKEECDPEVCRVIFKDNGFTDVEKTNSVQILKRFGINEIRSI